MKKCKNPELTEDSQKPDWMQELLEIMQRLRSPDGCPWDRKQTHASLKPFLIEECAELLDAIDNRDDENICEELGDILMHITFHARIAEEEGRFDFNDVARVVSEKMRRRHPHVFIEGQVAESAEDVVELWEKIKRKEKAAPKSTSDAMDKLPRHFPALHRAEKIQKQAAKVGFDWDRVEDVIAKIEEEICELRNAMSENRQNEIDEELGDLLFAVVNLSRSVSRKSAEELLAEATRKFLRRFRYIEEQLHERGLSPEESSLENMETLWQEAKSAVPEKTGIASR